jgi:hypothetical protein
VYSKVNSNEDFPKPPNFILPSLEKKFLYYFNKLGFGLPAGYDGKRLQNFDKMDDNVLIPTMKTVVDFIFIGEWGVDDGDVGNDAIDYDYDDNHDGDEGVGVGILGMMV